MPRNIALWFVALVAGAAALAAIGLRSLAIDAGRVEERLRQQSNALARATLDAVQATANDLEADGVGAIAFETNADGVRVDDAARRGADVDTTRFLGEEIDEFERRGDVDGALRRLDSLSERADAPTIAAWALSAKAALHARRGETELAREAWSKVVSEYPDAVDERGLRRTLTARWGLCELDGRPVDALQALMRDLIDERVDVAQTSLAALTAMAGDALAERDPAAFEALRELDRERQFARRLRSTWSGGISNWIASGAPGGRARFELAPDPLAPSDGEFVFVRAAPSSDGFAGVAIESTALARAALARPEIAAWRELGFDAAIARGAAPIAGEDLPVDADTVVERFEPPFDGLTVRARSIDIASARTEAERSFWTIAAISALALCAAIAAAWFGVRALAREAQAAHQREQFVAAVTHELKAPLASIRLLAELLEQGVVAEAKVREFGARTVAEADRLSRLISSVLEMARLERGAAPRDREDVVLRQLALDTLRQFEPLALDKHVAIQLHPVDESLRVLAHRDAVGSALFELLTNASKYAPQAAVEVAIERRGASVVLAVLDRGPGVPREQAERIFAPFERLGDELTREQPGVGLGLALVRKVAESHGGTARYAAREGGGSRFEIELPLSTES